jgi:hypothetical protein
MEGWMDGGSVRGELGEIEIVVGRRPTKLVGDSMLEIAIPPSLCHLFWFV